MGSYTFLKDEVIADIAFEAEGESYSDVFAACGLALCETMCDLSSITPVVERKITGKARTLELLLYDFLAEIIYLKDADVMVFSRVQVDVSKKDDHWQLTAHIKGERINKDKHVLGNDVKAVTMHMLAVWEREGTYHAKVVLDI